MMSSSGNNSLTTTFDIVLSEGKELTNKEIADEAFARFTFEEAIPAPCDMYYPKKLARDSKAREDFAKEKDRETVLSEKYVLDIIREEWGNEDERLQRIILG